MKHVPTTSSLLLLCLVLPAGVAAAQGTAAPRTSAAEFVSRHGAGWRVVAEPVTGDPSFLYGGRVSAAFRPDTDAGWGAAARAVVAANRELFGLVPESLALRHVRLLPLSRTGSTDKVAVGFDQVEDGIPVWNGGVSILFDAASGDVLALDTTAVPFAERAARVPSSTTDEMVRAAAPAFAARFGREFTRVDDVRFAIVGPGATFGPKSPLTGRGATLACVLDLSSPGQRDASGLPVQGRAIVSAEGDLTVFACVPTAHAGVAGAVSGNVNVGQEPNEAANQEQPALDDMFVRQNNSGGALLATTDAAGAYAIAQPGPLTLFFQLRGPFVRVNNNGGADASVTQVVADGASFNPVFNAPFSEFAAAEVAGFFWVNRFRDWIRAVDPGDSTMDFQVVTNVNSTDLLCNAYYDGFSINLQRAAGCHNTAYSDIILHEEGHWANERYNGFVTGAFHEGNADVFAYFINDDPCLSAISGSGCLRTATQTTVTKCPNDGDESCHGGEPHVEGRALASAAWAVRDRLGVSLGAALGDAHANALFSGWMNAFDDGAVLNVIQDHWLALDDDNGNLADLTPNFFAITDGFQAYGWPDPPDVEIAVTAPADNVEFAAQAPIAVRAAVTSQLGAVTGVQLHWALDGSGFQSVPMNPTATPGEYEGVVPGNASPNRVRFYVTATSSVGSSSSEPAGAPAEYHVVHVGRFVVLHSFDFEGGSDQGWTHASLSGQNGDQWERSDPANSNEATDPDGAFSGTNAWGTDLSLSGFDGKYEPDASGELRSPTFDLSGTNEVYLQYRRKLAVEEAVFDQASVRVNGSLVWQNAQNGHHIDGDWSLHDLDVTAQAAGNAAVQVQYRIAADGGLEFGGWNVDDFLLYRVDPAGFFALYGNGCAASGGVVPSIEGTGVPAVDSNITVALEDALPNGAGVLFISTQPANLPLGFGCRLLVDPFAGGAIGFAFDAAGKLAISGALPAQVAGTDWFLQFVALDPGAPNGQYGMSRGLHLNVP